MNEENNNKFVTLTSINKKELDLVEKNINKIIEYANISRIDKHKEDIIRMFIVGYRNLCASKDGMMVLDFVTVSQLIVLLSHALRDEIYINGSEYSLVYSNKKISIKENIRFITLKYAEENKLSLFQEAFTKKAIEYITENNMNLPIQMSVLPASIATEAVTADNIHGINISFVHSESFKVERSRYYTVETLCGIARKYIKDGIIYDISGNKATKAWTDYYIEMFKKTALRNIMKDAIFF